LNENVWDQGRNSGKIGENRGGNRGRERASGLLAVRVEEVRGLKNVGPAVTELVVR